MLRLTDLFANAMQQHADAVIVVDAGGSTWQGGSDKESGQGDLGECFAGGTGEGACTQSNDREYDDVDDDMSLDEPADKFLHDGSSPVVSVDQDR